MISPKDKPKKRPPKDSMTLLPCFYFVELPIVASSMASLYFLELTDVLQPARVGFHCYDRSLSMPYVDGSEELIPLLMLLSLAFAGPAASIMLGEGLLYCLQSRLKIQPRAEGSINAGGCNFNSFLRRTVRFVGVQIFGLLATALVTDVIQLATGYHTPFFLTVCQPNYTSPGVSCERNSYITRDICSGRDPHAILAARKSFPSQHATLSAFAAVYISMYFNSSVSDSTKLLKPVLVLSFCMAAVLTGLTQITQHHSHPIDVYAGFLIGASIAVYLALYSVGNFKSSEEAPPSPARTQPSPGKDALRALAQRGHDSVYHKGGASESNEELGAGPRRAEARSRQARREKVSLGSLKRASADVELLAPRSPMGKETMVTFSNTLPRANCPGLAPPEDPARRPLTFLVPPPDPLRSQQLMCEWKQRSLDLRGAGAGPGAGLEEGPGSGGSVHGSDRGEWEDGRAEEARERSATPSPLYPTVQANWGSVAMATVSTPPRVSVTPRPVVPPLVYIPEEAAGPPPVSPKSATTRAKWLSMTEQSGAPVGGLTGGAATMGVTAVGGATMGVTAVGGATMGVTAVGGATMGVTAVGGATIGGAGVSGVTESGPLVGGAKMGAAPVGGVPGIPAGPLRPPGQPRVAQVIAMSKHEGRVSLTPRSSETLSSCASSTSSSESACCHAPERSSSGIVTINAHAPHHPVVHLPPPTNGAPWTWRSSANGSSADVSAHRSTKSLSPASSVCDPAYEPHLVLLPDGHARAATPQFPASRDRTPSFERAGSTERAVTLERAGSLQQRSSSQL